MRLLVHYLIWSRWVSPCFILFSSFAMDWIFFDFVHQSHSRWHDLILASWVTGSPTVFLSSVYFFGQ
ncbi:hypothetical protein BDV30DRAFT_202877 [Aspergillus minisclerotigenes]|uniref:Uncharacterized protein n=1 Tax=Aspergillus minisclerotigenes TaxID=656917 RepID=A0A5N6JKT8_9EURO|nr:hypothetical protein BDV30DRAFT_202877 [Aspergillus minisclerotigenes]